MKNERKGEKRDFSAKGGAAFKSKYGKGGFQSIASKRWDRHFGRICLNCDQKREDIEGKDLPCERRIRKMVEIEEVVRFKAHQFNDPAKGKPPVRSVGKNKRTKKN